MQTTDIGGELVVALDTILMWALKADHSAHAQVAWLQTHCTMVREIDC